MQREFLLEKLSINKLNPAKMKQQLKTIRKDAEANKSNQITTKLSGRLKPEISGEAGNENYRYTVKLRIATSIMSSDKAGTTLDVVEKVVKKSAELQKWRVTGEAPVDPIIPNIVGTVTRPEFRIEEMTQEVLDTDFSDIVNRDAHLRTIHDSVEMFIQSAGEHRSNTMLFGEPGACKTTMFLALKQWYERDVKPGQIMKLLDSTTLTKAGLENWILDQAEANELPYIICLEEVEKFDMNVLLPLGSVMDGRGIISKLNARVDRKQHINVLIWMTCNNADFVQKWHKGFLWSRCTHKLECARPTRDEMENQIMPKKIAKIKGGDLAWIKPACDFGYDVLKTNDPREIIGLLDGRKRLLDGSYQADRLKILEQAKKFERTIDRDILT